MRKPRHTQLRCFHRQGDTDWRGGQGSDVRVSDLRFSACFMKCDIMDF